MKFAIYLESRLKEYLKVLQFDSLEFKDSAIFEVYPSIACNGIICMQKEEQRNNDIQFSEILYKRIEYLLTLIVIIAKIGIIKIEIDFNKFAGNII